MKNLKFFLPFAALGLLASCSNDNLGDPTPTPDPVESDGVYVRLNVAIPTTSMTGARGTLTGYDDGIDDEWKVDNLYLYIFKAKSSELSGSSPEAVAVYQDAIELYSAGFVKDDAENDDITNKLSFVGKLPGVDKDDAENEYYGLVVANIQGDNLPAFSGANTNFNAWNANTVTATGLADTDIPMIQTINGQKRFTMVSAPIATIGTDSRSASTLVNIDKNKFGVSPTAATEVAATFYIQRGVAKVTVGTDGTNTTALTAVKVDGKDADKVEMKAWSLDITNKTSYPAQNVSDFASWTGSYFTEAIGTTVMKNHIWWAVDPNYSTNPESSFNLINPTTDLEDDANLANKVMYCLENTSTVDNMAKDRITRVVFKGVYKIGGADAQDFIVFPDNGKAMVLTDALKKSDFTDKPAADYKISEVIDPEKISSVVTTLGVYGPDAVVTYYPGGVTYYTAYIRHFGADASIGDGTINNLRDYPTTALGHYGVVRNNSYKVNVNQVLGYGSNTPPTTPPDPIDKPDPKNYNMLFSINVLAWGTREDNYDLK